MTVELDSWVFTLQIHTYKHFQGIALLTHNTVQYEGTEPHILIPSLSVSDLIFGVMDTDDAHPQRS